MPHNILKQKEKSLNARYRHHGAISVLEGALKAHEAGDIALVSSFGAQSVVLLHMVSVLDRDLAVLFIDTQMLFPETLTYQREICEQLGLTNLHIITPQKADIKYHDPLGDLHEFDSDSCCGLRKTKPLNAALAPYKGWISGRKRFQGASRADLEHFDSDGTRLKINPLAHWDPSDIITYMEENRLPKHPLIAKGFPSIGCAPCTSTVAEGEDPRAGRWRHSKRVECGIHLAQPDPNSPLLPSTSQRP